MTKEQTDSKEQVVDIDSLRQDTHNFNRGTDEGQQLMERSFKELGAGRSILLDREGNIIAGNKSQEAARKAGIKRVRIVETTGDELVAVKRTDIDIDSAEGRRMALLDNLTTQVNLAWDPSEIEDVSSEIDGFDPSDYGFDPSQLEVAGMGDETTPAKQTEVKEDDFDPDAHYETKVKRGEVWLLGNHRLMCGDSTSAEDVAKLMNGERADLCFTDPPYGMKKESEGVLNDNLNYDDLLEFNKQWIPLTFANLKDNGSWYCWGIDEPLMDIYSNILRPMQKRNEITFRNLITWDKGNGQGQRSEDFRMYAIADEKCLFVMLGEQDMRFKRNLSDFNEMFEPIRKYFEDEKKKSGLSVDKLSEIDSTRCSHYWAKVQYEFPTQAAYEKIQSYCAANGINAFTKSYEELKAQHTELKKKHTELKEQFYSTRPYFDNTHDNMNNVWHFDRTSAEEREGLDHATPKPIALCARGIKTSSREGEIVLDVFGGSGSTMIACEQLNRKCRMMELDPHYCTVIIARWEKLTGQKAVKLNPIKNN